MECCNCGALATHKHHIVPKSLGGSDRPSNLALLCERCHGLIHQRAFVRHQVLTQAGVDKARAKGKQLGRPVSYNPDQVAMVKRLKEEGKSVREIGRMVGLTKSVVARVIAA